MAKRTYIKIVSSYHVYYHTIVNSLNIIFMNIHYLFSLLLLQELGAWKTRRRKQSEDAFQRVAEVKALEDSETGEPRKL